VDWRTTALGGTPVADIRDVMKVVLVKKYAEQINGVDLTDSRAGDVLDLPPPKARLLVAEEWAMPERREQSQPAPERRRADDYPPDGSDR
jgi:hypothetical protein